MLFEPFLSNTVMSKSNTPLMQQYHKIKNQYPNTLILFRMGDFFETFFDDATILSKICGITLTARNSTTGDSTPLAGFPHHQLDNYLPKLVRAGCRVAVCEQVEDPKTKKGPIVQREVVEVVTPGVSLYEKLLESTQNNYLCSLFCQQTTNIELNDGSSLDDIKIGLALCDISTGELLVAEVSNKQISELIEQYAPSEIIYSKEQKKVAEELLKNTRHAAAITKLDE